MVGVMDQASMEYFRERERIEREAASNATCDTARLSHEQLADGYAALIRNVRKYGGTLSGRWSSDSPSLANIDDAIRRHNGGPF
jgi:hypothetical protein